MTSNIYSFNRIARRVYMDLKTWIRIRLAFFFTWETREMLSREDRSRFDLDSLDIGVQILIGRGGECSRSAIVVDQSGRQLEQRRLLSVRTTFLLCEALLGL